ncbi:NAD(P)/FAD-dependent oxidoreductase [Deinococcus rubellus]|uniref:NAD(P)/FAD-dependent oxidoreductase n=1 Tax=Deinococcus rubellus TaxID=1889240 RepID=A0ABY5YKU2_9DEIO|nr:NAD(P)/FAD-dependent oxidoreductase [Deinococcus rubellus]UWX65546.1 NAD(P)/FAD-dependent oxidoreductase [Deinococcus rubellus]
MRRETGRSFSASHSIGILGGGLAGLSLAALLAEAGHAVTLYESGELGGKLGRLEVGGLTFSTGPSLFTFPGVWRRYLAVLGEADGLDLQLLPGGLGLHHTPFGTVPLPPGHPLSGEWDRYVALVRPLRLHIETLLTTPPRLSDPAFLKASAALGRVLGSHLTAERWTDAQRFSPLLAHALKTHALNAGLSPHDAPALYALLPALIADEVSRPAGGMAALLDELIRLCQVRGVRLRPHTPVTGLEGSRATVQLRGETVPHDLIVSALDPARRAGLSGKTIKPQARTVSGMAIYAAFADAVPLPATSIVAPTSFATFRQAMRANALPPDTLALVHAEGRRLALLLTVPATGQRQSLTDVWVRGQVARAEAVLGVPGLLDSALAVHALGPEYYTALGTPGGSIYGAANPFWRAGPFHPQPYRVSKRLWQVGTAVHPGGGIPAILGGALIVARLIQQKGDC